MQWQAAKMAATWTVVAFLQVIVFIVVRTVIEYPPKMQLY
jgi:hypothetical protein